LSFCNYAIQQDDSFLVPDTLKDSRFSNHPLVHGAPNIRSYIGVPLRAYDGHRLGTLCVIDRRPRRFSERQINILVDIARLVIDELELRRLATRDSLTGAMTRRFFMFETEREFERTKRYGNPLNCVAIDIDHFKVINDTHGHAAGDCVLKELAAFCRRHLRTVDLFGRLGGEEFAIALPETTSAQANMVAEKLRKALEQLDINHNGNRMRITASFGVSACAASDQDFQVALKRADQALYMAKDAGRNRSIVLNADRFIQDSIPSHTADEVAVTRPTRITRQARIATAA
jgi:diguanylate cyclase (GGDEF)-like protein